MCVVRFLFKILLGMGGGYGPMDGPMGGGFPPMMNMGAGVMDGHGMDMRRNNDNQVVLLVSNLPDQVQFSSPGWGLI